MTSSRVEIQGQFNSDYPCSAYGQDAAKVDQATLSKFPQNWNAFCRSADEALKAYTAAKNFYKFWGTFSYCLIFGMVIFLQFLPLLPYVRIFKYAGIIVIPFILPLFITYFTVRGKISNAMKGLERVCTENSGQGVRYHLGNEHFGGCSKPHVRRYFITVIFEDEEMQTQSGPILPAPVTSSTGTIDDVFPTNPLPEQHLGPATSTGGTKSLFDQLKA